MQVTSILCVLWMVFGPVIAFVLTGEFGVPLIVLSLALLASVVVEAARYLARRLTGSA